MKLTKNQMEILYDLLKGLDLEISNRVCDFKEGLNNFNYYDEIKQGNKELRVIRSVMRKLSEEIRIQ